MRRNTANDNILSTVKCMMSNKPEVLVYVITNWQGNVDRLVEHIRANMTANKMSCRNIVDVDMNTQRIMRSYIAQGYAPTE